MHDFCFTIPYGMVVAVGGVVGYARRGSTASLAGGVGSGVFLLIAGFLSLRAFHNRRNSYLAFILETADNNNFLNVKTPSPPSVRTYDVVVSPLYHDRPIDRRCNWATSTTKKLCYIFSSMAADASDERMAFEQHALKETQTQKDLEAAKANFAAAEFEKIKLVGELEEKLAAAKVEVVTHVDALKAYQERQAGNMGKLMKLRDLDKAEWSEREQDLLAQIDRLKKNPLLCTRVDVYYGAKILPDIQNNASWSSCSPQLTYGWILSLQNCDRGQSYST